MKCFTVQKGGRIIPHIACVDGEIRLGESGRGRELTKVPVPGTATLTDISPATEEVPVCGAWQCPASLGGGYWTGTNWFRAGDPRIAVAASQGATVGADTRRIPGSGNLVALAEGAPDAVAVLVTDQSGFRGGWSLTGGRIIAKGYCAQGAAGNAGGGPEYLLVVGAGEEITLHRTGRLYGDPDTVRIRNVGGELERMQDGAPVDLTAALG